MFFLNHIPLWVCFPLVNHIYIHIKSILGNQTTYCYQVQAPVAIFSPSGLISPGLSRAKAAMFCIHFLLEPENAIVCIHLPQESLSVTEFNIKHKDKHNYVEHGLELLISGTNSRNFPIHWCPCYQPAMGSLDLVFQKSQTHCGIFLQFYIISSSILNIS
jgi:hypothetical protein